jgi:gamma-glutamyltranspeptidase
MKQAQKIVAFIQKNGGLLSLERFKELRTHFMNWIELNLKKYSVISMSPPSMEELRFRRCRKNGENIR